MVILQFVLNINIQKSLDCYNTAKQNGRGPSRNPVYLHYIFIIRTHSPIPFQILRYQSCNVNSYSTTWHRPVIEHSDIVLYAMPFYQIFLNLGLLLLTRLFPYFQKLFPRLYSRTLQKEQVLIQQRTVAVPRISDV